MSWTPPERPDWVAAVNRGEVLPIAEEARAPLSADALLAEALALRGEPGGGGQALAYGHPDFPAEPFVGNLERLVRAIETEAGLTLIGRWMMRRFLLRLLGVRLQLMAWLRADPGVQEEEIVAPVVVAGAPRTGTTILHALLAADPRHRAPLGWELLRPVPPPDADPEASECDARVELAERELVRPQTVVSGLTSIHAYGSRQPKECLSAMSFALQSEEFTARLHVPGYADWLEGSDMTPAYAMHRLVLQILQRRRPGTRWVLKSPVHLHSLPTLFATYPDARVAITHRDPLTFLASLSSLIANLRWAHSDGVDPIAIARDHVERYRRSLDRLVDAFPAASAHPESGGAAGPGSVHHSLFHDFLETPIETVEGLYSEFAIPLDESGREAIRAELARRPRDGAGPHRYASSDFGLDETSTRALFRRYQEAFGVPDER